MPIHDWAQVPNGIFHHFHHRWLSAISDELNGGRLPGDYYALAEQVAGGLGPDVLTLEYLPSGGDGAGGKVVAIRYASGDRVVAVIEVVSPANKDSRDGLRAFVSKATELLEAGIHLLVIDL